MMKMLIGFRRRSGMSVQAFKDYRRDVHAPLLFAIPEAANIRRFVVSYPVPAPNWPEPTFDAVVEAWFDTMSDMERAIPVGELSHKGGSGPRPLHRSDVHQPDRVGRGDCRPLRMEETSPFVPVNMGWNRRL